MTYTGVSKCFIFHWNAIHVRNIAGNPYKDEDTPEAILEPRKSFKVHSLSSDVPTDVTYDNIRRGLRLSQVDVDHGRRNRWKLLVCLLWSTERFASS